MNSNEQLVTRFYQAFQAKDYSTMQSCYADSAVFNDEVYRNLSSFEVRAMWKMFCIKGKNLHIEYSDVVADDKKGSATWVATYTFSKTNRPVVNRIKAYFTFSDGKIIEHRDYFDFYRWAGQALGWSGMMLGWTSYLKNKVRKVARKNLEDFMKIPA